MSLDKALEIIERAMASRSVYDTMAARENQVWGKILPDRESSEAAIEDRAATEKLNANRYQSYLIAVAKERNLTFQHGLTVGRGAGRLERLLVQEAICRSFHGMISPKRP